MKVAAYYNLSNTLNGGKIILRALISDRDYRIYELVNFSVLTSAVSLFGVMTNVVNIVVFYRQGFDNTMNISLMGLSVSDLCSLITMLMSNMFVSPFFDNIGARIVSTEIQNLVVGLPHMCFIRITSWITVFITAERCLCIMFPLKIKQLITKRRTTAVICTIYILIMLSFEPEYETMYFGWKFVNKTNRTLLGVLYTSHRHEVEGVVFIIFAMLGFVSFIAVIIFTLILVIQLNTKSKWRKTANLTGSQTDSMSNRDRKTVTMVAMIATILFISYAPGVVVSMATFCVPEFNIGGAYVNAFFTSWSFAVISESLNSSVNIFLYYRMSSKYRETFNVIFGRCMPKHV